MTKQINRNKRKYKVQPVYNSSVANHNGFKFPFNRSRSVQMGTEVYVSGYTKLGKPKKFNITALKKYVVLCDKSTNGVFMSHDNLNVMVKDMEWSHDYWRLVIEGTTTGHHMIGL